MKRPIVVSITGASGAVYAIRLLEVLLAQRRHVHLIISPAGATVLNHELGLEVDPKCFSPEQLRLVLPDSSPELLEFHVHTDYLAAPASGSYLTSGMVVCPCSGGTLSAIAQGTSRNLIQRAADVHLKERRKLILVPRETPLSLVYIENMHRACAAGAVILPAMPGWYHGVRSVDDLVDFVVARILDQLAVEHELSRRWGAE